MNAFAVAPWVRNEDDELTFKTAFAAALLRFPNDPFRAGMQVFPTDQHRALTAAQVWINDPVVINAQAKLLKEFGEENFLPSKFQLARRIYEMGENERATFNERLAAFRLYADLRNFIEKGNTIVGGNIQVNNNRVMVLTDHGSDDEWEAKVEDQQSKLIEHVRD